MLRILATGVRMQANKPNIHAYEPHAKQEAFHRSQKRIRLFLGGNRSGKTTSGVVEDIYYLRGQHPHKKVFEPPIAGRAVAVDILQGINQILIPNYKQWAPPSLLINGSWEDSYNKTDRLLTLSNGSTVEFMTYEQDVEKFAGTARHFVHYDEEPPMPIFNECQARLIDYNAPSWLTLTPLEGMTWIYDTLYIKGEDGGHPLIDVFEVDMLDNPHISPEAAEAYLAGLDPDEREARAHGKFMQLGGKVYKAFDPNTHVIEAGIPPKEWEWARSLDHGYNNPTAVLWHAASPTGQVITFAEHYKKEWTVDRHAKYILEFEKKLGKSPELSIADPAIAQRQGVTGTSIQTEYAKYGVFFAPGNNDVITGVNQVNHYIRPHPKTNKPSWHVTENCPNLIRELQRLRWKTWAGKKAQFENNPHEQIHKKDDHASDSLRYYMSFLPDLAPEMEAALAKLLPINTVTEKFDVMLAQALENNRENTTEWRTFAGSDLFALEYDGHV
jgi:phage terminase large subunit-like protein